VGPNATLQIDNQKKVVKIPDGRHLTVFNSQNIVQIGGKSFDSKGNIEAPFQVIYYTKFIKTVT